MRLLRERPSNERPQSVLLLARHGETTLNAGSRKDSLKTPVQGQGLRVPLSEKGLQDARLLGGTTLYQYLTGDGSKVEVVRTYTSGALRGRQTLEGARVALLECGVILPAPVHDIGLAEFYKGGAEGLPLEEVQKWYTDEEIELRRQYKEGWLFRHGLPHSPGETGLKAGARMYGALTRILREPLPAPGDPSKIPGRLIIVHNVVTSYGLDFAEADGVDPPFERARSHRVDNGAVHVGEVFSDGNLYLSPQLLTATGKIVCEGCVSFQAA